MTILCTKKLIYSTVLGDTKVFPVNDVTQKMVRKVKVKNLTLKDDLTQIYEFTVSSSGRNLNNLFLKK
jgi:hypothetical protein